VRIRYGGKGRNILILVIGGDMIHMYKGVGTLLFRSFQVL